MANWSKLVTSSPLPRILAKTGPFPTTFTCEMRKSPPRPSSVLPVPTDRPRPDQLFPPDLSTLPHPIEIFSNQIHPAGRLCARCAPANCPPLPCPALVFLRGGRPLPGIPMPSGSGQIPERDLCLRERGGVQRGSASGEAGGDGRTEPRLFLFF